MSEFEAQSMAELFQRSAVERPDAVALRTPGGAVEITWGEYAQRAERVAASLAALGIERGATVALMLTNRPEFNIADTGALLLGATPFSIYNTLAPEQIAHLLHNSECRVVVTESQFVERIAAAKPGTSVRHVVCVDAPVPASAMTLHEFEALGLPDFDIERAWRAVEPDDVATLVYTSGTTGPPKGVEITHAGIIGMLEAGHTVTPFARHGRLISYLPSAHAADRFFSHYVQIATGSETTCLADARSIAAVLPEVRPTSFGAVPRIWEKLKAALEAGGIADPAAMPEQARAAVRARIGLDAAAWAMSGAAPIAPEVIGFFLDLGLPICELWGMTEMFGGTINPPGAIKLGTVGPPLPGVEARIADDGELLIRSKCVMRGYRGEPEKTAEAIDSDGWLHTGDVAQIDEDGYLKIVDRKKELIVSAGGKNMSPVNIENTVKGECRLVAQAVAIGDRRPYNVALLTLDSEALVGRSPDDADVVAAVRDGIERANARLARVEQIKRFHILPSEWVPGGDEVTPTMKLKRKPIAEKYAAEIDALYAG
jgi:long-subunit acyl-CoA synthetase (AMP-forming)